MVDYLVRSRCQLYLTRKGDGCHLGQRVSLHAPFLSTAPPHAFEPIQGGGWVIRRQIGHDVVIHSERLGGVHGLTPD